MGIRSRSALALTAAISLSASSGWVPATASSTASGRTSVPVVAAQARSQGSDLWGYVGDIDTRQGTTYTYGIGFDPTDASLTVTDSGKVEPRSLLCIFSGFPSAPCQMGTPRVFEYPLVTASTAGVHEAPFSQYTNDGTYGSTATATTNDGQNAGLGLRYAAVSGRTVAGFPAAEALQHGPRGVAFTADGTAWVVDSEAVAPTSGPAGAIKRYGQGLAPLTGAGWTGVWAERDQPGLHFYRTGAATTPNNTVLVNSEVSDRLQEYAADGTWLRSIKLDLPAGTAVPGDPGYRSPYAVGVDPVDGTIYPALINFRDDTVWQTRDSFIERRDADGNLLGTFGQGRMGRRQVVFNVVVEPRTQDVFAWTQFGNVQQFHKDGTWVREFTSTEFPGLTTVRGLAFDGNGRMYFTVAEGSNNTRVMILGKTPDPVTAAAATCPVDRHSVTLTWENDSAVPDGQPAPYQQSSLLDFVVEKAPKGTSDFVVVPKAAPSTELTRTIEGLDDASAYDYRISAWNEAGNGDTAVVAAPTCEEPAPSLTIDKTVTDSDGDGVAHLGETLDYSFLVTNTGNVALEDVTVTDSFQRGGAAGLADFSCPGTTLGTGASMTCTASYTVTQADVDAGSIDNEATVAAVWSGTPVAAEPDTATIATGATASLSLTKTAGEPVDANGDGVVDAGDTVVYTFQVGNTGNVTVTDLGVDDPLLAAAAVGIECEATQLAPGESTTCTSGAYVLTGSGVVTNTATAHGIGSAAGEVRSPEASASVTLQPTPTPTPTETVTATPSPSPTESPSQSPSPSASVSPSPSPSQTATAPQLSNTPTSTTPTPPGLPHTGC